jgi:hypothetical protein
MKGGALKPPLSLNNPVNCLVAFNEDCSYITPMKSDVSKKIKMLNSRNFVFLILNGTHG